MFGKKKSNPMPYNITDSIKAGFSKLSKRDQKEFQEIFIRNPTGTCAPADEVKLRNINRKLK